MSLNKLRAVSSLNDLRALWNAGICVDDLKLLPVLVDDHLLARRNDDRLRRSDELNLRRNHHALRVRWRVSHTSCGRYCLSHCCCARTFCEIMKNYLKNEVIFIRVIV